MLLVAQALSIWQEQQMQVVVKYFWRLYQYFLSGIWYDLIRF
jgi:hypothetical protein